MRMPFRTTSIPLQALVHTSCHAQNVECTRYCVHDSEAPSFLYGTSTWVRSAELTDLCENLTGSVALDHCEGGGTRPVTPPDTMLVSPTVSPLASLISS